MSLRHRTKRSNHYVKHGLCYTSEYNIYYDMLGRCYNKNESAFKRYGGRGIKVCDRWKGKDGFVNFYSDMGKKPTPKHTIERIDNKGNYEPSNCKWATYAEQNRNKSNIVWLTYKDKTLCLMDWARELGLCEGSLRDRLRIHPVEVALSPDFKRCFHSTRIVSTNTSGITGVSYDKKSKKFEAYIDANKKRIHLGRFDSISVAALVRQNAEREYRNQ